MGKIELYVIQREDSMFYYDYEVEALKFTTKPKFTKDINKCFQNKLFGTKHWAEVEIKCMELQNCRPVKVKIEIVGE